MMMMMIIIIIIYLTMPRSAVHNYNMQVGSAREILAIACHRYRVSATVNRSLPDIPIDSHRIQLESGDVLWENSEPNGDTSSELYATVEENKNVSHLLGEDRIETFNLLST
jgi:hypothetical protein